MCFHEHEPEVSLGSPRDFANPSSFGTIPQWAGNSARSLGFCYVWICIFHFLRSPNSMGRVEGKEIHLQRRRRTQQAPLSLLHAVCGARLVAGQLLV